MSSRKRSSFPTDYTKGNDILNRSKKSKRFPSSNEAMSFNMQLPQQLESDRIVKPPSVTMAYTSCQDRNTGCYDLDLMVSKDTEQLRCREGSMSNSSGNNVDELLRVQISQDNLNGLRQYNQSQVSKEDESNELQLSGIACQNNGTLGQGYSVMKARKKSKSSHPFLLNRTLESQKEGGDADPSYRAIPFYLTPPPLFTMNCANFGAWNFSPIHQKPYQSVFTNQESSKELFALRAKFTELRNQKIEGNQLILDTKYQCHKGHHRFLPNKLCPDFSSGTAVDLKSNYSELSQAINLGLLKDHHHQGEAEYWQKSFISHQEQSAVANSLDPTWIMSHQDLYQMSTSQTIASNDTESLVYRKGYDDKNLSQYQCQIRKLIEYFEAGEEDVKATIQGRNKPIVLKQVGIRCYFCSKRAPQHRTRGSTYYPTTLQGLYQACQNLASVHLCQNCPLIPESLSHHLMKLRKSKSLIGGGKLYWADSAKSKGIEESHGILINNRNNGQTTTY